MAGLETVYAIHHFDAENPDEIAFAVGEPILVLEKDDGYNDGWWQGRNVKGEIGLFPMNYTAPQPPNAKSSRTPSIDDAMAKLQLNSSSSSTHHHQQLPTPSTSTSTARRSPDLRNNSASSLASAQSQPPPPRPLTLSKNVHKTLEAALTLTELKATPPEDWAVEQVCVWVQAMGFESEADNFRAQEITGDILLELTLDSLKELDINTFGKRFKIHSAINALREHCKQTSGSRAVSASAQAPGNATRSDDPMAPASHSSPHIPASDYASSTTSDEYPQSARLCSMDSIATTSVLPVHRGAAYRHSEDSIRPARQQQQTISRSQSVRPPQHHQQQASGSTTESGLRGARKPDNYALPPSALPPSANRPMVRNSFSPASKPQAVVPVAARSSMDSLLQRSTQLDVVPDMEGWLHKQGDKYKTWNRRWFVLKGPNLFYFKSPKDVRMKGIINLRGYKIINDETICAGKYCFKVQHDRERTFYFYTESERTLKAWINALMKATIARDYAAPVLSSSTVPTVSLDMARRMKPRPPSMILYKRDGIKAEQQQQQQQQRRQHEQHLSPIMDDSPTRPFAQQTRESGITDYDDEEPYQPTSNNKRDEHPPRQLRPRAPSSNNAPSESEPSHPPPPSSKRPTTPLDDSGFQSGPISSVLSPPHSNNTSSGSVAVASRSSLTNPPALIHHRHLGDSDEDLIDPQHHSDLLTSSRPGGLKRLTEESHGSTGTSIWSTSDYIDWIQQHVDRKVSTLSDLRTGDVLIELLENLSGKDIRRPPPTTSGSMHVLDNFVAAFKFMGREGVEVDGRYTIKDVFGANEPKIKEMLDAIKTWSDTAHNDKKASGGTFGEHGNFRSLDQDTTSLA